MAHATLTTKVNHVQGDALHRRGDIYEFQGTDEELRELLDGGLVETDVKLGRASVASDVRKHRDEAELERSARLERDQRIADLMAENATLKADLEITNAAAVELRGMLGISDEDSILVAVKALASGDPSEVVKERDELATEVELLRDQVTGYSAQNAEIRKLLKLSDDDAILEAIKVLGETKKK